MSSQALTRTELEGVRNTVRTYQDAILRTVPSHLQSQGESWIAVALAAIRQNPDLVRAANNAPDTLIKSLYEAAQWGLHPGTAEYYFTPRTLKGRGPTVLGVIGYQGWVELMYRSGAVSNVIAEVVREKDEFAYVVGRDTRPIHSFDPFGDIEDRGPIWGAYAYAVMKDGATSRVVFVNQARIERAKKAGGSADKGFSPWATDEETMVLKTAVRDLRKWVPTSAEYRREIARSEAPGQDRALVEAPSSVLTLEDQAEGLAIEPGAVTVETEAGPVDPVTGVLTQQEDPVWVQAAQTASQLQEEENR